MGGPGPVLDSGAAAPAAAPWTGSVAHESMDELRQRYDAYRRGQAAALPGLLPREAVRGVYRAAREDRGAAGVDDPLALLTDWCARLLPLPPFDVWVEDYRRNRDAYLEVLGEAPAAPTRAAPVTVDLRALEHRGRRWYAGLDVFRDGDGWRGVLAFHAGDGGRLHRTGDVFHGSDPRELRERFLSFDDPTLEAFLRSVLP